MENRDDVRTLRKIVGADWARANGVHVFQVNDADTFESGDCLCGCESDRELEPAFFSSVSDTSRTQPAAISRTRLESWFPSVRRDFFENPWRRDSRDPSSTQTRDLQKFR